MFGDVEVIATRQGAASGARFPAYALTPVCQCGGSCGKCSSAKAGAFCGLQAWAQANPLLAFAGVFALGMLLGGKNKR